MRKRSRRANARDIERGVEHHLYVILDIFSRYVVGWMLAHRESAALAQRLITESCASRTLNTTSSPFTPTVAAR